METVFFVCIPRIITHEARCLWAVDSGQASSNIPSVAQLSAHFFSGDVFVKAPGTGELEVLFGGNREGKIQEVRLILKRSHHVRILSPPHPQLTTDIHRNPCDRNHDSTSPTTTYPWWVSPRATSSTSRAPAWS